MKTLRFGLIGFGNMGTGHAGYFPAVKNATLAAVCDVSPEKRAAAAERGFKTFDSHTAMFDSGLIDAVIIAVPHYDHMPIAAEAFERGLHVLCEKPIAVSVTAARQGIAAYQAAVKKFPQLKFGLVFQQRTSPIYKKLRQVIAAGELGDITRITWIVTNWFRTWTYYASGGWRATWKGEGGGVIINQCPHNLDLIQHLVGGLMPNRITAVGAIGKTHPIEVEDEISAILEYPNGAIGHFVTTTGEAPGTNRLEICGDRGRIVAEDGKLKFTRLTQSAREINQKSPESFPNPEIWQIEIPYPITPEGHQVMTEDFVDNVLNNKPNESLIAPGPEGVRGLEIGNAILQSALTRKPVDVPVDGAAYDQFIEDMAKQYGGRKTLATKAVDVDMGSSYQKA